MAAVPGPWLLVALNGAVLLAAVAVAAYVRHRRGRTPDDGDDDWRSGAAALAREVRRATALDERPADHDRVSRRLLPLAGRIHRHVRAAPAGVEEPVYRGLFELGVACQRVAVEHRPAGRPEGPFLEDRLASLHDDAEALVRAAEAG